MPVWLARTVPVLLLSASMTVMPAVGAAATVIAKLFVFAVFGPVSVARTTMFAVPAADGVPLITPVLVLSVNPAGSTPENTEYVNGVSEPEKKLARETELATPTVPLCAGTVPVNATGVAAAETVTAKLLVLAVFVLASVARTTMFAVPAVVGVPLITPVLALSVIPAGKTPEKTE